MVFSSWDQQSHCSRQSPLEDDTAEGKQAARNQEQVEQPHPPRPHHIITLDPRRNAIGIDVARCLGSRSLLGEGYNPTYDRRHDVTGNQLHIFRVRACGVLWGTTG